MPLRPFLAATAGLLLTLNTAQAEKQSAGTPKKTAAQDPLSQLPAMTVSASSVSGYSVSDAFTATKTDTSILETPASIQVIPKQILDDQQAFQLEDVYRNVSGVYALQFAGSFSDNFLIRGFEQDRTVFRDGFRVRGPSFNLANVEQIEVLKGPVGMLYGQLQPGGMINLVTKRPLATPYYSLQQQFGSFRTYRTTLDTSGRLTSGNSLLARLNAEYLNQDSFADFVDGERTFIAPSVTWRVTPSTQIDLDYTYQRNIVVPFSGVPIKDGQPLDLPRSRFLGEPDDRSDDVFHEGALTLTHVFNQDWKIRARFSIFDQDIDFETSSPRDFDESSGVLERTLNNFQDQRSIRSGTLDFIGHFNTLSLRHALLIGANGFKTQFDEFATGGAYPTAIDVFNPVYGQDNKEAIFAVNSTSPFIADQSTTWWGVYIQDQIEFAERWHLLLGTRYDDSENKNKFTFGSDQSVSETNQDAQQFSYRAGLLYQPLPYFSVFGSYVDAFTDPNTFAQVVGGGAPKPQRGEQFEVGVKGESLDGRLSASLVYFRLEKQNIPVPHADPDLANLGFAELVGVARSQGVEMDLRGHITNSWRITASYAYTDTKVEKDQNIGGIAGNRLQGAPLHGAGIWSEHNLTALGLPGFSAGAGYQYVGQRAGDPRNTFILPGYGLLNLGLGYTAKLGTSKVTARLNVNNVLDKKYFKTNTFSFQRFATTGAPRTFLGSIRVEF